MGGWERNIIIFGAAGVAAVIGLFVGGVFAGLAWTFLVLAVAMFLALGRFGPDRVTLETWMLRRWRYARSVRRYTYAQPVASPSPKHAQAPRAKQPTAPTPHPAPPAVTPITFANDKSAYYGAVTVLMVVAGIVFLNWLRAGGDADLARSIQMFFGR